MTSQPTNKPSLKQAEEQIFQVIDTVYYYERDEQFLPGREELIQFERLNRTLRGATTIAEHISQRMQQRFYGG